MSAWLGGIVALAGLLVLLGWALDVQELKSVVPGLVSMKANTAVGFVLSGIALLILGVRPGRKLPQRIALFSAVVVIMIGGSAMVEYLLGVNLGIDELLVSDNELGQTYPPGRMAPTTALNFFLLGLALLLLAGDSARRHLFAQILAIVVGIVSLFALIGYAYDVGAFYQLTPYTPMALNTSLLFLFLCFAVLLARPDSGLMRVVTSNTAGGILIRRLLPALVGVPAILGWLVQAGHQAGLYDGVFSVTLFAILSIVVLGLLAALDASALHSLDLNRRQADETIKSERDFVSAVVETIDSLIVVLDRQGRIVRFNHACEELTGYMAAEVEGKAVWDLLLLPEEREPVEEVFAQLTAGQFPNEHRNYWVAKNGRRFLIDWSNTALLDRSGRVQFVVAAGLDVTERLRYERLQDQLVLAAANLANQSQPREVSRVAMESGLAVLEADTAVLWQVDGKQEELILQAFHSAGEGAITPPPMVPFVGHQTAARSVLSGRAQITNDRREGEGPEQAHDDLARRLGMGSLLAVPLRTQQVTTWVLTFGATQPGVFSGLEQHGAEILAEMVAVTHERARLIDDLRSAVRVREEFLNLAAHELKTPLTTLVGYTQLLLKQRGYDDETMRLFRTIKAQGDRVGRLGQSILDVSQIQSGDLSLRQSLVDLSGLAEAAVRQMQVGTTRHQLSVESSGPVLVDADQDRIQAVLLNLLDNAIKYSPLGGPVEVSVASADSSAFVHVSDHGLGIPREHQASLFEAFFQVAPMVSPTTGLGLGLYISREIIQRHGGRIWFESEPGKGSSFSFTLPLAKKGDTGRELPAGR